MTAALAAMVTVLALTGCTVGTSAEATSGSIAPLVDGVDLGGWEVTAWPLNGDADAPTDTVSTGDDGSFSIQVGNIASAVLVNAKPAGGDRVLLSAVVPVDADTITLNERTTVAAGYSLAQFFGELAPSGDPKWLANAALMGANLADASTGDYGAALTSAPNGSETSTLDTFTSLANVLSACLVERTDCEPLFGAGTEGGVTPMSAASAFAGVARDPSASVQDLFDLSTKASGTEPGLSDAPAAWTLALRFDYDGKSIDGPGNFAIDDDGDIWINNNYEYGSDPSVAVCGSDLAFEFGPDGSAKTTLQGGGLSGSGFGIAFDRSGKLWFSNYGFAAPAPGCPDDEQPPHNSMSLFDGETALSPDEGFTQGDLSWPQGTAVAGDGTVWIANCGNSTVAIYPEGDPDQAQNLGTFGLDSAFDVIDNGTQMFVSGNVNSTVAVIGYDGTAASDSPLSGAFDRPMGLASDAAGNVWVANSGGITLPCPDRVTEGRGTPSVTMISPDGTTVSEPYLGGGVTLPWGIATDGDGNVWVANFEDQRVSAFCGADAATCPRGLTTGDAISPDDTGYSFDGLTRSTGIAVDPSGNVWVTNNWLTKAVQTNPGGHQIVAYVGAAAPVPVEPFE